jgi:hypothetical protein
MKNQSVLRSPVPDRHLQGVTGETAIDPEAHWSSHNLSGIKVNHNHPINPALMDPKGM